jgi:acyl-CoA thioesterase FadM
MYPYLRTARMLLVARFGSRLAPEDESVLRMRIWPGDIDIFLELNNGRFLTLMDQGRLDFGMRTGLIDALHRRGWGLTVAGVSVRFRHRVRPFERILLRTSLVGNDERWFYFDQSIERAERVCAGALVRTAITSSDGIVPPEEVREELGWREPRSPLPAWVSAWIAAEGRRPWPR